MFKKTTALFIAVMIIAGCISVSAAGNFQLADLIVTDLKISNPNYKVGDVVSFEMYVTNVGGSATPLGWGAIENIDGLFSLKNNGPWSALQTRPYIFPGETKTIGFGHMRVDKEVFSLDAHCNSSAQSLESNYSNDVKRFTFTPSREGVDLVITDIRATNVDFAEGAAVAFEVDYQNIGLESSQYASVDIELVVNGKKYILSEITDIMPKEKRTLKSENIFLQADQAVLSAYVNCNETVLEEINHSNNSFSKTIKAVKSKQSEYTWDIARLFGGGFIRNLYVNPKIKDSIYFLGDVSGAYKYDSYANINYSLMKKIPQEYRNGQNGVGFAVDSKNPDIMFYAGGKNRTENGEGTYAPPLFMRSFDGGENWEIIDIPFEYTDKLDYTNGVLALDPNNSNILWSCSDKRGIWKTETAIGDGIVFENVPLPGYEYDYSASKPVTNIIFDENVVKDGRSQIMYVSVENIGIYKSTDAGKTFSIISGSPSRAVRNMWLDANGRLIVAGACGVLRLENEKWNDITPTDGNRDWRVAVNPTTPTTIIASEDNRVYVSTDDGATWREILQNSRIVGQTSWHWPRIYVSCVGSMRFDPFRNNTVYFGSWFGAYKIEDITAAEIVVHDLTYGTEQLCVRTMATVPEGTDAPVVIGVNDANGVRIKDPFNWDAVCVEPAGGVNGPQWMQETMGWSYCEKQPLIQSRVGLTVNTWTGNGLYSKDGGATWTPFADFPVTHQKSIRDCTGKVTVAADVNNDGNPTILINTIVWDEKTLPGRVWRSTDMGENWEPVDTLPLNMIKRWIHNNEPIAADKVNKDVFYAYDSDTGNFYNSVDNGVTFNIVNSERPVGDYYSTVTSVPEKEGHIFVSISGSGLWYSSDYGRKFVKIEQVEHSKFFDLGKKAPCSEESTMYVLGKVKGVEGLFRSIDLGKTWVKINDESQKIFWEDITAMKADRRTFGLVYVGCHGFGITVGFPSKLELLVPRVGIYENPDGKTVSQKNYVLNGGVTKQSDVKVVHNGKEYDCELDENLHYSVTLNLAEGDNSVTVTATDSVGHISTPVVANFKYSSSYVGLSVASDKIATLSDTFDISGSIDAAATGVVVSIDGERVPVNKANGTFSKKVLLNYGINNFEVVAETRGRKQNINVVVDRDIVPPTLEIIDIPAQTNDPLLVAKVKLSELGTITVNGITYNAGSDNKRYMEIPIALVNGRNNILFELKDSVGNYSSKEVSVDFNASAEYSSLASNEVNAYEGTPVIDGEIDDDWILDRVITRPCNGLPLNAAKFGMMADKDNLYLAIKVFDKTIMETDTDYAGSYNFDTVEVFFDPQRNRTAFYDELDQQIRLGISGKAYSAMRGAVLENVKVASKKTADGYVIEAAFPWDVVGASYGSAIGFDVSVNDSNSAGGRDGVIVWSGNDDNYKDTSKFGTLYYKNR